MWLRPGYRDIDFLTSGTLEELHEDIFELFEADTTCPALSWDMPDEGYAAEETTLDSLNLKDGATFVYLFDFGDDWIHEITVLSSSEASPSARKL